MRKNLAYLTTILFLMLASTTHAQIGLPRQQPSGQGAKINNNAGGDLSNLISNTINLFFAIGGIAFTIMIIWGAVEWILSGGDKEGIAKARKRITTSIIGLVVLSLTFVITIVVGQITGIDSLKTGNFGFKGLLTP